MHTVSSKSGILIDIRELKPLSSESIEKIKKGKKLLKEIGIVRTAIILDNIITALQFKEISIEIDTFEWERYIDALKVDNWEDSGENWIVHSLDPYVSSQKFKSDVKCI